MARTARPAGRWLRPTARASCSWSTWRRCIGSICATAACGASTMAARSSASTPSSVPTARCDGRRGTRPTCRGTPAACSAWSSGVGSSTRWHGFAVQQPRAMPDGRTIGSARRRRLAERVAGGPPLVAEAAEHAGPTWGPGQCSYAWSPDGTQVAFTRNERGFGRLCVVDTATGLVRQVARGVHGQLSWQGHRVACVRTGARTLTQIVSYDTDTWERTIVAIGPSSEWQPDDLVEPELVEVPAADGSIFARHYAAPNHDGRLIVWLHGGPTDQWQVTFMPRLMFWLSRGWSILVPDHRGSTGHGRAYQQALHGRWGELDVADTLAVARCRTRQGLGQPRHDRGDGKLGWRLHRARCRGCGAGSIRSRHRVVPGHRPRRSSRAQPSFRAPLHAQPGRPAARAAGAVPGSVADPARRPLARRHRC
jgi:hypothetical protein